MKTLSCRFASFVSGISLFVLAGAWARADIVVDSSSSFGGVTIYSSSGSVSMAGLQSSAFAQAGANAQYNGSSASSAASASDVPVSGGLSTGAGTASSSLTGSSSATGSISGATPGFDTSTGRASANGMFEVTGASGPVTVTFSAVINGALSLSADAYGVFGQGETDFSLSVNGNAILFSDLILTVGPNQSQNGSVSETLTGTMTLQADTDYDLWLEADSETTVVNAGSPAAPDNGSAMLEGFVIAVLLVICVRQRRAAKATTQGLPIVLGGVMLGWAAPAQATYIGSDPPNIRLTWAAQPNRLPGNTLNTSLSEGNNTAYYPVVTVGSGYGPTIPFALTYNSYNADGSRAQLDTGLGFGWTHSYNSVLFQQRGQLFRLGENGRVTQYYMNYSSPGTYTSAAGYFENLTSQPDGTFYITNKYQSWWHFGTVPNTPFLIGGPVYRLLQMGDRNQNSNTMSYNASGLLTKVTDPYGRTLQFTYNTSNHLSSVTDPLGRTTQFQYDSRDRELTQITDPLGKTIQYTYNAQYQMTREVDQDGRTYFYTYKSLLPFMVTDGNGQPYFSMSNPTDWAVNLTNLAFSLVRQYLPGTTSSTDGRGNVWQYAYDTNGYITQVNAPDGALTRYTYDPATLGITSMTDANGHVTRYNYDANGNRISMTDALGNVTTYTYDPVFNQMTSMTDPNMRITTNNYDARGNLIQETEAVGTAVQRTTSYTYEGHGNCTSMTDALGRMTIYDYDTYGNLMQETDAVGTPVQRTIYYTNDSIGNRIGMTDPLGRVTLYQYDARDRLTQETDAVGTPVQRTTDSTYDGAGDCTSTTDARGIVIQYQFDLRQRLNSEVDAVGTPPQRTNTTTYDGNNNRTSMTDPLGIVTQYQYDTMNRLIQETDAVGTPVQRTTATAYDAVGNTISTTDANGYTTTYSYDALNRRISMTDPLSNTTIYDYANSGGMTCCGATAGSDLVTAMIDPDGTASIHAGTTYYNYDALNRLDQVVRKSGGTNDTITPSDAVTTTTYDADNNRIAVTDPNNNTTSIAYDPLNRPINVTNAAGDVSRTTYDPLDNAIQTVDPRGNVTSSVYDALNRLVEQTDSLGAVLMQSYDPDDNVISSTDGNGNVATHAYDVLNRPISMTDALGHATTTVYDPDDNVLSTTDREGNTTLWAYDALNRQSSMTDPLGFSTTMAYDPDGNVISTTDPLSHTTQYSYDADDRLIQETYPDTLSDTRSYTYDGTGRLTSRLDQNGQTTTYQYNDFYDLTNRSYTAGPSDQYGYDLGGRLINATRNGWADSFTYDGADRPLTAMQNGQSVTYSYDIPSGIRSLTYPGGMTVTETYDLRSRLMTVNDGGSPTLTQYTYDLDDNILTRANRNGTVANYTYNANDWNLQLTHSNSSTLIAGFAYAYDNEGNITYQSNQVYASDSQGYTYDTLYRLTNFEVGALSGGVIPSPALAESWSLDAVDNWTAFTSNAVAQSRTYNAVNELLTINGNPFTYDANGNLLGDGTYAYTYDGENRLASITRDSDSALVGQYSYDGEGRRISSLVNPSGSSATNVFFYDGSRIVQEQNAAEAIQASYTYGPDGVLTMQRGGQTYYYHPNGQSSIAALTEGSGAVAERYNYDAYGQPIVLNSSDNPLPLNSWGTPHSAVGNPWLFVGARFDEESGLYHHGLTQYDPLKGRFLQRSPADSPGWNLYAYGAGNPVTGAGPTTLASITGGPGKPLPRPPEPPPAPDAPKRPPPLSIDAIKKLIEQLDSQVFADRQSASQQLEKEFNNFNAFYQAVLVLLEGNPSLEQRRRLEDLLRKWASARALSFEAFERRIRGFYNVIENAEKWLMNPKVKQAYKNMPENYKAWVAFAQKVREKVDALRKELPKLSTDEERAEFARKLDELERDVDTLEEIVSPIP